MNEEELSKWTLAGRISGKARDIGAGMIEEDTMHLEVVEAVEEYIHEKGAEIAFPINIAINDVAAHYTPKSKDKAVFRHGDLVKIDVGAHIDGYIGDTARTVEVGSSIYSDLIEASRRSLEAITEILRGGISVSTIGSVVERTMMSFGFKPIINLTGHSIKRYNLHAGISVPNYDDRSDSYLPAGTIIAIEPFSTTGVGEVKSWKRSNIYRFVRERAHLKPDQEKALEAIVSGRSSLPFSERWLAGHVKRADKALTGLVRTGAVYPYPILKEVTGGMVAQTEHTFYITDSGCRVLTR